jgi:hypothetical protein
MALQKLAARLQSVEGAPRGQAGRFHQRQNGVGDYLSFSGGIVR